MTCHHTFNQALPIAVALVLLDPGSSLLSGFVWKRSLMPSATPTLPLFWVSDTSVGTHLGHIHYSPSARNALASDFCMVDFFLFSGLILMSPHREAIPDHPSDSGHLATLSHDCILVLHIVLIPCDGILFVTVYLSPTEL